jgi:hypothetical protein
MKQLNEWFERKLRARRYRLRTNARAMETWSRCTGPRNLFGQVTLSATPADEFSYFSRVSWPDKEQFQMYEDCVLDGILNAILIQRTDPVLGVAVTLEEIAWNEIESCALAYGMAAQQAMNKVLSAGGSEPISAQPRSDTT